MALFKEDKETKTQEAKTQETQDNDQSFFDEFSGDGLDGQIGRAHV